MKNKKTGLHHSTETYFEYSVQGSQQQFQTSKGHQADSSRVET